MSFWPLAVVRSGVVRAAARLESSVFVASASALAFSATGPEVRDCMVEAGLVAVEGGVLGVVGGGRVVGGGNWIGGVSGDDD